MRKNLFLYIALIVISLVTIACKDNENGSLELFEENQNTPEFVGSFTGSTRVYFDTSISDQKESEFGKLGVDANISLAVHFSPAEQNIELNGYFSLSTKATGIDEVGREKNNITPMFRDLPVYENKDLIRYEPFVITVVFVDNYFFQGHVSWRNSEVICEDYPCIDGQTEVTILGVIPGRDIPVTTVVKSSRWPDMEFSLIQYSDAALTPQPVICSEVEQECWVINR